MTKPCWFVYLLECADHTLYCGITNDLENRLAAHNGECRGGAKYTRSRRPVSILASVLVPDKSSALKLERQVQKTPRSKKLARLLEGAEVKSSN